MKKKITKTILLALLISFGFSTIAQVAINTDGSAPDASAVLDVKSTDKGMLTPRMTQSQIEAILNPVDGLIVFNTTDSRFYFYDNTASEWKEIAIGTGTITPTPTWACGDAFVDARNGQSYTTVQIGTQCWMADNLNIGSRIDGANNQTDNSTIEKYCYNDDDANCTTYGGLYQWDEMMQYTTTAGVQGICPSGWSIPTDEEWTTLTNYLGGESIAGGEMKEAGTTHWDSPNTGATNNSGFTALPGGLRHSSGSFYSFGGYGDWWSSTENSGTGAWRRYLSYDNDQVSRSHYYKTFGFSVRCLKN